MPFKVTQSHPLLCNRHGMYDWLLALNSNLTSIFNRSTTSLSCETGRRRLGLGGHALVSGCPEHWTILP